MASIGHDELPNECPHPETNSKAIAAKIIGGALVALLIAVSLVELPDPAKDAQFIAHCHLEGG